MGIIKLMKLLNSVFAVLIAAVSAGHHKDTMAESEIDRI